MIRAKKYLVRWSLLPAILYVGIFLFSLVLIYTDRDDVFCGLPSLFVTLPWSLLLCFFFDNHSFNNPTGFVILVTVSALINATLILFLSTSLSRWMSK